MAAMASNHDLFAGERLWNQVEGDIATYKMAAAAYLLAPATPFVYYGEEIGMASAPSLDGDPRLRTPMSWSEKGFGNRKPFRVLSGNVATQNYKMEKSRRDSLLAWYRALIHLRSASPVLLRGRLERSWQWGNGWAYSRELDGRRMFVLFNSGVIDLRTSFADFGEMRCSRAFPQGEASLFPAATPFVIPAHSVAVYDCR
jgi:glycosidase